MFMIYLFPQMVIINLQKLIVWIIKVLILFTQEILKVNMQKLIATNIMANILHGLKMALQDL